MRRTWVGCLAVVVAGLGALIGLSRPARAADTPWAGTWKVTVLFGNMDLTLALLKVEDKDGKPKANVVSTHPELKGLAVEDFKAEAGSVRFTLTGRLTLTVAAYPAPKGAAKPQKLLGSGLTRGQYLPLQMEQTDLKELDEKNAQGVSPGFPDLQKAAAEADAKKREAALQEVREKFAGKPVALVAARLLLQTEAQHGAPPEEVRKAADRYVKLAGAYGPEMERQATYAALKLRASALRKAGKTDELKEVATRLARLEEELDREFVKRAVPFPTEPYAGRTSKSDRVVVVELFTGAQCPPCVAADIAFDAALQTYKPSQVALLEYHLHIPGPDALTNADTEARARYYGKAIRGTPTMFVDGTPTAPLGGPAEGGKESYDALRKLINKELEEPAEARIKLDVKRKGDRLALEAQVSDLKKTGAKVRLRFALVEDVVHYAGNNGQRLHHHVVRSFPGGVEGFALTEKTSKQSAKVSLGDLAEGLTDYLKKYQVPRGEQRPFAGGDFPLKLEHLKVVAFVQDDDSRQILQAAQADVPAGR
jgi:hypothetical protein